VLSTAHSAQHFFSSLLAPLIPILAVSLSLPLWKLGALVSLYSLVSGFGQAPIGELSDRYDRRLLLAPGLGLRAVGYVVFGSGPVVGSVVPTLTLLDVSLDGTFLVMAGGMVVTGAGSSAVHPTGYPLISANVRAERKGRALGIWGSASKFGDTPAPIAIAVLILVLSWDSILLVLGVAGVGYAVVLALVLGRADIETRPPGSNRKEGPTAESDPGSEETTAEGAPAAKDRPQTVTPARRNRLRTETPERKHPGTVTRQAARTTCCPIAACSST
jgi:MFS family permease